MEGAAANGSCFIEYTALYTGLTGNVSITSRSSLNNVTECKEGFYTDVYSVKFYDNELDERVAFELNQVLIIGLSVNLSPLPTSCIRAVQTDVSNMSSLSPTLCTCDG